MGIEKNERGEEIAGEIEMALEGKIHRVPDGEFLVEYLAEKLQMEKDQFALARNDGDYALRTGDWNSGEGVIKRKEIQIGV